METSFGNWIKRRRKALDLTQEELAQRVGCSKSAIFKIEADERRPSRQIAELLAKHLEIPAAQQDLFMKVARQEKATDRISGIPPLSGFEPALASIQQQNNLPIFPTQFVGREHENDFVARQLLDPACRLLTLTGPGGVGKTRLAVEVARRLEGEFSEGVFFLSMAAASQPESILPTVADGLGVVFSGPAELKLQVIHYLRNKEVLLVFDNMEHLISSSGLLGEILQQTPHVKLLITSREPMRLQWEWIFEVQGLPVPEEANLAALNTNSAVNLFLQRARQTSPGFSVSAEDSQALVMICKSVDGLPLAIELAASWVRILSLREIALELEQNLDFLETTMQDVAARHRSIKAVFEHSWELLTGEERAVLMKCSVFASGFPRAAASKVAGATLSSLSSLVSKSLLRYNQETGRYDLHELVRQYASAKLHQHSAEEAQTYDKHSQYYSGWVAGLEGLLKSAQQAQTSAQLRTETGNWISAWRWAVKKRRFELLRQMIPCLYWYYEIHGYYAEALSSYKFAVSELRAYGTQDSSLAPEEKSALAFLVDQLGWFESRIGNVERARELFAESLELARDCNDPEVLYYIYGNWGYLALLDGDAAEAKRLTLESLANAQELHSQWHIAIPTNVLGIVELQQGNLTTAYQQLTDTLNVWRAVGDPRGLVFCMLYLSSTALALGNIEVAEAISQESNAIAVEKKDRWAQASALDLLGRVSFSKGQREEALGYFRQSLALSEEIGDKWGCTISSIRLGEIQASLGEIRETERLFREAYLNAQQAKWVKTILDVLFTWISINHEIHAETRLAVILAVLSHPAITPYLRQQAERLRDQLERSLTAQQIETARGNAVEKSPEIWGREIFRETDYPST